MRSQFTGLGELAFSTELLAADFVVSMPKLKTHHWAAMTASMKNLFGTVPGALYGWPKNILHFHGIENSILDLTATIRPQLAIVDAIVAMEGDGPIMGRPRGMGFIAMGSAGCRRCHVREIIGFDPAGLVTSNRRRVSLKHRRRGSISGEALTRYATRFKVLTVQRGCALIGSQLSCRPGLAASPRRRFRSRAFRAPRIGRFLLGLVPVKARRTPTDVALEKHAPLHAVPMTGIRTSIGEGGTGLLSAYRRCLASPLVTKSS
jgi:hypothetical protein